MPISLQADLLLSLHNSHFTQQLQCQPSLSLLTLLSQIPNLNPTLHLGLDLCSNRHCNHPAACKQDSQACKQALGEMP